MSFRSGREVRGFALVYVLGLLVGLSVVVLSAVRESRSRVAVGNALVQLERERFELLQAEAAVKSRLALPAEHYPPPRDVPFDWLSALARRVQSHIDGGLAMQATVMAAPAGVDPNVLDVMEWSRLLVLAGLEEQAAGQVVGRIMEKKRKLGRIKSFDEISLIEGMPPLWQSAADRISIGDQLVLGTLSKRLNVMTSPLPLFSIILNADESQLGQLAAARRQREVKLADAVSIFGPLASGACRDGPPDFAVVRLRFAESVLQREILVKRMETGFAIQQSAFAWIEVGQQGPS